MMYVSKLLQFTVIYLITRSYYLCYAIEICYKFILILLYTLINLVKDTVIEIINITFISLKRF